MKTKQLTKSILFLILFSLGTSGFAQEFTKTESSRSLEFCGESKIAEVKIPVGEDINVLRFNIHTTLKEGKAQIEILDPDGEVKGTYSIVADAGGVKAGSKTVVRANVKGTLERQYRDPAAGDWMVKITPKDALGLSTIETGMINHPKADILEIEQIEEVPKIKK